MCACVFIACSFKSIWKFGLSNFQEWKLRFRDSGGLWQWEILLPFMCMFVHVCEYGDVCQNLTTGSRAVATCLFMRLCIRVCVPQDLQNKLPKFQKAPGNLIGCPSHMQADSDCQYAYFLSLLWVVHRISVLSDKICVWICACVGIHAYRCIHTCTCKWSRCMFYIAYCLCVFCTYIYIYIYI